MVRPQTTTTSWNKMINTHVQNNQLQKAREMFDKMPHKDIVSWNTILSGLNKTKNPQCVYKCFKQILTSGLKPTEYTVSTVLTAVSNSRFNVLVPQIHGTSIRSGLNRSVFVGSALIGGYASVKDQTGLTKVFDDILMKDVTSWNALVSGYMDSGCVYEARKVFDVMPEKDVVSWTTMVNGYVANKMLGKARALFNEMNEKNVVSWTTMISGYVQHGKFVASLKLFGLMVISGVKPNHFTFSVVFDACSGCSSLRTGQQVHASLVKIGFPDDVILFTSLVDMYAKTGDINAAFRVFESMNVKNLVSWNTMIGGYARHGLGTRAVKVFEKMIDFGFKPDQVSFINVLSGCCHSGLVEEGEKLFRSMKRNYGLRPGKEHYGCMVDLYGRAGRLDEAVSLIELMPFRPDVVIWGALLGACGLHSRLELGEFAAEGMMDLKRNHPAAYTALSKIYGEKGVWDGVIELRNMMVKRNVVKQRAGSWVE